MQRVVHAALIVFALVCGGNVVAAEYMSVANPTIIYDAQSLKANRIFVASRYYPFEVMVKLSGWVKVRDFAGDMGWVESKNLSDKRTVIVTAAQAEVYAAADAASSVVLLAERSVILEPIEAPAKNFVKVKHRDGQSGYVKTDQIWGH
ncbi:MAG: SH3 domain-containing protein [Burkholderiales bacterium]